jgi:hypothetical protein
VESRLAHHVEVTGLRVLPHARAHLREDVLELALCLGVRPALLVGAEAKAVPFAIGTKPDGVVEFAAHTLAHADLAARLSVHLALLLSRWHPGRRTGGPTRSGESMAAAFTVLAQIRGARSLPVLTVFGSLYARLVVGATASVEGARPSRPASADVLRSGQSANVRGFRHLAERSRARRRAGRRSSLSRRNTGRSRARSRASLPLAWGARGRSRGVLDVRARRFDRNVDTPIG